MAADTGTGRFRQLSESLGHKFVSGVEDFGYGAVLFVESVMWLLAGHWMQQRVRVARSCRK